MNIKKLLAVLISLAMVTAILPAGVLGVDDPTGGKDPGNTLPEKPDPGTKLPGEIDSDIKITLADKVSYIDGNGEEQTEQNSLVIQSSNSGADWSGWMAIKEDVTISGNVKLSGDVNLILADGKTLTLNGQIIGMDEACENGYDITVYGQRAGTGKLKVYNGDTSGVEVSAIKCSALNLYGGVIEAQTADKASWGANRAVVAKDISVAGGNLNAVAGNVKEAVSTPTDSLNVGVNAFNTFTLSGGAVTAKSGDVDTSDNNDKSYAVMAGAATVSGGTLVTDYEGTNAENRRDIFTYNTFEMSGGTFKSSRESEAVNASCRTIRVSGGTVKLEKGKSLYIATEGEIKLGSILAPSTYCFYQGSEVDVTELSVLGDTAADETVYIVPFGEEPYDDEKSSAVAIASTAGSKTVYIQNPQQLADVLTAENTESIKLLSDVNLTSDIIEGHCVNDDEMGRVFPITAKKLTLDLNDHVLAFSAIYTTYITDNFVIKDSGKNKAGCLVTAFEVLVAGNIEEQALKTAQLTVESGTLRCMELVAIYAEIVVSGGNIVTDANVGQYYISLMMGAKLTLTKGLIESAVLVGVAGSFEMTGGKLGLGAGSMQTNEYIGCIDVQGRDSSVKISGGSIKELYAGPSANIQLFGGEFEAVYNCSDSGVVGFLAPGYAFYSAKHEEVPVSAALGEVNNVMVKPHTCSFAEDAGEDSYCACGRRKFVVSGSAEGAIAKIICRTGTKTVTGYVDDFGLLVEVMAMPCMATITLLSDVEYDFAYDEVDIPVSSNTVLDLNGHTLDLSRKDDSGKVDYIASLIIGEDAISTFTVKDSSKDKTGLIKADMLFVEFMSKVNLQGGKITCVGTSIPNVVCGSLAISGGTLDVHGMVISRGSLTVTDGVLTGEILSLNDYNGRGKSVLSIAEGQEKQNLLDRATLVTEAKETGDNMLVSGGEVKVGEIMVSKDYSAKITGGKIGFLSEEEPSFILNYGGNVTISGGEIEYYCDALYALAPADERETGSTVLKGGKFGVIYVPAASKRDVLGYLEDGCAYYSTESGNVTLPVIDEELTTEEAAVYVLNNVEVKSHSCTFNEDGYCACGRRGKANTVAVPYIDENGKEKQVTTYKKLTGEETKLATGWYVVDGNITASAPITLEGDVNLILTDGSNFTVNGNIVQSDEKKGTLTICGQSENTGSITVKGAEHTYTYSNYKYSIYVGFYVKNMVVNGGIVNAFTGINNNMRKSYAIMAYGDIDINGGFVNTTCENSYISAQSDERAEIENHGIYCSGQIALTDGVVNVSGGNIYVNAKNGDILASGISGNALKISGGVINTKGGDIFLNEIGSESVSARSNGVDMSTTEITGGNLFAEAGKCSSAGNNARLQARGMTCGRFIQNGGNVTLKGAEAQSDTKTEKVGIYTGDFDIKSGTFTIVGNDWEKDIWPLRLNVSGGTIKAGSDGAIKATVDTEFNYNGGNLKFKSLYASGFTAGRNITDIAVLLADGYAFYTGYMNYVENTNNVAQLNTLYVYKAPTYLTLKSDDRTKGVTADISKFLNRSEEEEYAIKEQDNEISASIDAKTGLLTVKATENTEAGSRYEVYVAVTKGMGIETYMLVKVEATEKKIPTVTVSSIEKVYDGLEIKPSAISNAATVTDGEEVILGEWQWLNTAPTDVTDDTVHAVFYPNQSEVYATVTADIHVKITAKSITGEPTYTLINEAGKTLADAALQVNKAWPRGTLAWVDENGNYLSEDTKVIANREYKWRFVPKDSRNYSALEDGVTLYKVSQSSPSSSGGRKDDTVVIKNPDGSSTTVTQNKLTGTVTKVTQMPNGTTVTEKTEKDGTVTTTEKRKDGTTVNTVTGEDGTTKSEIKLSEKKSTEITVPVKNADNITKITVTDKDGNKTVITEFEKTQTGIKLTVSDDCTVEISNESKEEGKTRFADILGHWSESAVQYMIENGLMNGVSETEFAPDSTLTRAMLVTILYRAAGLPAVNKAALFSDVSADSYYSDAVIWAQQNAIVFGITENEFAPEENITREQIATILYRFAKAMGYDLSYGEDTDISSYADAKDISEYALEAVRYAVGKGLLKGKTDSSLNPRDNATRAELATMIQRFLKMHK